MLISAFWHSPARYFQLKAGKINRVKPASQPMQSVKKFLEK
tara:strand:- start:614 stop:736 length:123 start_codon:yes stop_codon:yes gene_type:complete